MSLGIENIEVLVDKIKLDISQLRIVKNINEHSEIHISALFKGAENKYLEMMATKTAIEVNMLNAKRSALYRGYVNDVKVRVKSGIAYLEITGVSYSHDLDRNLENRSFQNAAMTFKDLIATVGGRAVISFAQGNNPELKIGHLLLQYRETDWQFLRRMAARYRDALVVDDTLEKPTISFGVSKDAKACEVLENKLFTVTKDCAGYYEYLNAARRYDPEYTEKGELVQEADFIRYHLNHVIQKYEIGDQLTYRGQKLYVCRRELKTEGSLLRYAYTLVSENGLKQKKLLNEQLAGAALNGTVIGIEYDRLKVRFDFDAALTESKAWKFPFATFYSAEGNTGWYCMPQKGETVRVFFPVADEEKAFVTNVIHPKMQRNYQNRFFTTSEGQHLLFDPAGVEIGTEKGTKETTGAELAIRLDEATGVSITSEKDIQLASSGSLELVAGQKLIVMAEQEIQLNCKASCLKINELLELYGTKINTDPIKTAATAGQTEKPDSRKLNGAAPVVTQPPKKENQSKGYRLYR